MADVHGKTEFLEKLNEVPNESTVIFAGDLCGGRGLLATKIVACFYDVRRNEATVEDLKKIIFETTGCDFELKTLEYGVKNALHSGTFDAFLFQHSNEYKKLMFESLKNLVKEVDEKLGKFVKAKGLKLYLISGNGEASTPFDYDISEGIGKEKFIETEKMFYNNIKLENVEFVDDVRTISDEVVLVGMGAYNKQLSANKTKKVVVHYPPTISILEAELKGLAITPSQLDKERCNAVEKIVKDNKKIYFGHFHNGKANELPDAIETSAGIWLKPGALVEI